MPSRVPPGPFGGWFREAWYRDFPVIREVGFNTLRILSANPVTAAASGNLSFTLHSR